MSVSKKFENLSTDDWDYLEKVLCSQLNKEFEEEKAWKNKHGYSFTHTDQYKLVRLVEAVKSQKNFAILQETKW